MASIGSYLMIFWFVLIVFISFLDLILADASSSTCPNNKDSVCTILPFNINNPRDVWLNVPDLHVDEISLVVEDLKAHVSLSTNVASLVSLIAGVAVSIDKVNFTIKGVKAQVQLAVHLDNIAKIINLIDSVLETVSNLLGIFTDNGQPIHQVINSVGKIVNQLMGSANKILSSTIVGDYQHNMTFTGISKNLANGYVIKQYSYSSSSDSSKSENIFIDVLFDTFGNTLNTNVVNPPSTLPSSTSTTINVESTVTSTTTDSTSRENAEK